MAEQAPKRATYQDVLDAPEALRAEVIDGQLHLNPRPARRHVRTTTALGRFLGMAFDDGIQGPGGWIILDEPELHLGPEPDILVPDLAGWRESRFPGTIDDDDAFLTVAPDWVSEVLSTGTSRVDRTRKMPIYARETVSHVWLVDPRDRTVEVFRLGPDGYVLVTTWASDESPAVLEPFAEVPIPPKAFWGRSIKR